jgi:2-oxoglutarate ferredoxin oxidoreductase subunit alpha
MAKALLKGCEAIGEAAIRAGCRNYFCYPITPQNEVGEYLSHRLPEVGGVFLQGESEVAVSYMIFGAAAAGQRVFTTSSSPGISLMSEGISYIAGARLPAVLINIIRGGPGLGGILPAQSDYFQAVKGGGHGDYRCLVLAPSTVQEAADLTMISFGLAEKYRNPVMILADGMIGQMMEPVEFKDDLKTDPPDKESWATTGCKGRPRNLVRSLFLNPEELERNNLELKRKYDLMEQHEVRFETAGVEEGTEIVIVAFGTMARIVKTAIEELRKKKIKAGLLRPITLFPFPSKAIGEAASRESVKAVLTVEMNMGQMVEDVERAVQGIKPVEFFGRTGGIIPSPEEVIKACQTILKG